MIEHEAEPAVARGQAGRLRELPLPHDEVEAEALTLEFGQARADLLACHPLRVRVDVGQMPHSDDGDSGVLADLVELRSHLGREIDPRDEAGDGGRFQPGEPDALVEAVARLHDHGAAESGRGQHPAQIAGPEVPGDRRHGLRVDPVLRVHGPVPQVHMGVDACVHARCHTSSTGCHSAPGSRSSAILIWHGSVCVHHSCDTGSSAIRRMSASWSSPTYS